MNFELKPSVVVMLMVMMIQSCTYYAFCVCLEIFKNLCCIKLHVVCKVVYLIAFSVYLTSCNQTVLTN